MGRLHKKARNLTPCWKAICPGHPRTLAKDSIRVKCGKTAILDVENDGKEQQTGKRIAQAKFIDLGWALNVSLGHKDWMCPKCSARMAEMREHAAFALGVSF